MAATFVVVPEWQGSGSSRAMRLVDGAEAIRGDLPSAVTRTVSVPLEAGDSQGTSVHRLSSIALVRDRVLQELSSVEGGAIVVGGGCSIELGAIGHALERDPELAVVWLDAHPDLNTPDSSPSGSFGGMVLRTLLGDGPDQLVPPTTLLPERVVVAGCRSFDPAEDEYIGASGVTCVEAAALTPESLVAAVEATGASSVYIHIDVDVIDPGDFSGLTSAEPFGVPAGTLVESVKALVGRFRVVGAGITEFAPKSPAEAVDDMPTILRLVGALAPAIS